MPDNKYYSTTRYEIEAAAFRRMAAFIHEHYEDIRANDMTGEEGWLLGVVNLTETLLQELEAD